MLILLDHSTPAPLRYALKGHVVVETVERGWERLVNGDSLEAAETARIRGICDGRQKHPVSAEFSAPKIAVVTLGNAQWPVLRRYVERVAAAVDAAVPGSYVEVEIPFQ